jgi:hypothetical protein
MGLGRQHQALDALPPRMTRYPLYMRLCGLQGRSGRVRKISAPIRIRSPERPAPSESLYRLSYPGCLKVIIIIQIDRIRMQVFIEFVVPQTTTDGVTKSNGTLGYIHWTGERSIARLPVMGRELTPIQVTCLSLGLPTIQCG